MDDLNFGIKFIRLMKGHVNLHSIITKTRMDPEWNIVAAEMNYPAQELMHKWHRMRDSYRAELRRELDAPLHEFEPKWRLYGEMQYMRDIELKRIRPRNPSSDTDKIRKRKLPKMPEPMRVPKPEIKKEPASPPAWLLTYPAAEQMLPLEMLVKQEPPEPVYKQEEEEWQEIADPELPSALSIVPGRSYCIPKPLPDAESIAFGLDGDYDFLMARVYPYLSCLPLYRKKDFYNRLQKMIYDEYMQDFRTVRSLLISSNSIL
uniref:MADF domain-containing protein n=1 Tax=Anopheles dirus TaxID=7168 RepID=A0A182MXP7_9DIPT